MLGTAAAGGLSCGEARAREKQGQTRRVTTYMVLALTGTLIDTLVREGHG